MRVHAAFLAAAALSLLAAAATPAAAGERAGEMFEVESDGRSANVPVALTSPFAADHRAVETAIVFIHGVGGEAPEWRRTLDALAARRGLARSVYVVAPQFLEEDAVSRSNLDDFLTARWTDAGWIDGGTASSPTHTLSYHVAESALRRLADPKAFPNLKRVTVAGFSAGGQFVQRFAVVSEIADALAARGIAVRFVVGSSNSFLYFGAERPTADGGFAVPSATECQGYNDWPFGPREAPNTLKEQDKPVRFFAERYARRDVVYTVGERETEPLDDQGCEGLLQGDSRAGRLASYWRYMKARWPGFGHRVVIVPGFGHDRAMFAERPELFDLLLGENPPDPPLSPPPPKGAPL